VIHAFFLEGFEDGGGQRRISVGNMGVRENADNMERFLLGKIFHDNL
jgi:hypothetical protein